MKKNISSVLAVASLVAVAWLAQAVPSVAQAGTLFVENDMVGVRNSTPAFPLDVNGALRVSRTDGGTSNIRFAVTGGAVTQDWLFQNNGNNGNFAIRDATAGATPFKIEAGAPANLFTLTAAGQVQVKGSTVHSDFVFEPDYALLSIEDHAQSMWANKHLPAVGAGRYDERGFAEVDLLDHNMAILEELEVAHIYIAQLDQELKARDEQIVRLADRLAAIERLLGQSSD